MYRRREFVDGAEMNRIEQLLQRRAVGRTTCATMTVTGSEADTQCADRVVEAHGFRGLGAGWVAVSATDAHAIVTTLLHRDLAHQSEIMPRADASDLATQFFDLAPEPHSYFTNGDWEIAPEDDDVPARLTGWDPISDASFDSGIVCVGDGVAALLWIEDED